MYAAPIALCGVAALRPIIESSARMYTRVIMSTAEISGRVGPPLYSSGSLLGTVPGAVVVAVAPMPMLSEVETDAELHALASAAIEMVDRTGRLVTVSPCMGRGCRDGQLEPSPAFRFSTLPLPAITVGPPFRFATKRSVRGQSPNASFERGAGAGGCRGRGIVCARHPSSRGPTSGRGETDEGMRG